MCFSKRLKKAREAKGVTLSELGKRIGKTEATVQRYESGNIKNLKNETIEQLADALNVNPAYLMGWITDKPENSFMNEESAHYNHNHAEVIAAHIDDDATDEEIEDILAYIEMRKSLRNKHK